MFPDGSPNLLAFEIGIGALDLLRGVKDGSDPAAQSLRLARLSPLALSTCTSQKGRPRTQQESAELGTDRSNIERDVKPLSSR